MDPSEDILVLRWSGNVVIMFLCLIILMKIIAKHL